MKRLFAALLAVAAFSWVALPTDAGTTDYGSGLIGDWSAYSHCDSGCRGVDTAAGRYVYSDSWDAADVAVAGDSITARSWGDLYPLVTKRGHRMAVNYWSGRPTTPLVDWLVQRVQAGKHMPSVLIVASGANDIYSPAVMASQVRRLKAALPSSATLIWVDVQVSRVKYSAAVQVADQRNSMAVNQQIYTNLPYERVIRWSELFWGAPWRLGYYLEDGVHPKVGTGTRCWAAAISIPLISQGVL